MFGESKLAAESQIWATVFCRMMIQIGEVNIEIF
jgi:hypothetical protein